MKIIRVVSELDFGGVEQVLALSVPRLAEIEGVEILVIVLGRGGNISDKLIQNGYRIIILNHKVKIPNLKLIRKLKKIFKKEQPHVVHCQGSEANFHGLLAARWVGIRMKIGEEIGFPNHHSYWKWIFYMVYLNADKVIAISNAVKLKILNLSEVREEKVKVLYNPVDVAKNGSEKFLAEIDSKPSLVFITTGRLVKIKNYDTLIRVFSTIVSANPQKSLELWIVGDGPERSQLEQLALDFKIGNLVKFYGYQENVRSLLVQADVFVLPSFSEGSSVSLGEAMINGLPSIVTEVGGAGEILGGSQSGLLIDPLNSRSIFDAINYFINLSKIEKVKMGLRAKLEAQRFLVETYVVNLLEIYKN